MDALQRILENKLVAIIRGVKEEDVLSIAKALSEGGITVFEITADTPGILRLIEKVKTKLGGAVTVGAGTVLDPETARAAIMAGAEFIFSPTVSIDTILMTKRYGAVSIPGAMTPTEILSAYEQGADVIKVFPADTMGPRYMKDIHGPLPHIPLMPTGGVNLGNVKEYLNNGAVALGLGGALVKAGEEVSEATLEQLRQRARQFVGEVDAYENHRL